MRPIAITCSRYRAFKDEVRIELRPLTVIIGKNGGGKSVLARLPLALATGLSETADGPIGLVSNNVQLAARFEDIIYLRSAQPFSLGAELHHDGVDWSFRTTMRHIVEHHTVGIEEFWLKRNGELEICLNISDPAELGRPNAKYLARSGGATEEEVVKWSGLFPSEVGSNDVINEIVRTKRAMFAEVFSRPAYLGPFRQESSATGRVPRQGVTRLESRGEGTLDILGDDTLRKSGELAETVGKWFESALGGSRVFVENNAGVPRLAVEDVAHGIVVDIAETGAGYSQVLPIVTQVCADIAGRLSNYTSIVEQPELHLHPGAHGYLADLFVEGAVAAQNVAYICETHSEQFVTRVRRRVAEGKIAAASVQLISVGHQADINSEIEALRVIALDMYGNPSSWPVGVFDEALNDLVHIREAGLKREAEAGATS